MQTTLEPTTAERLLIYQNDAEINRITSEAQSRVDILNNLNHAGVTNDEIKIVCISTASIDSFIHKKVISENEKLRELETAGVKFEYKIPEKIQATKYLLLAWFNYPGHRHANKFENLIYVTRWEVDAEGLENYFIRQQHKIFVVGEKLKEYKRLEMICEYLEEYRAPSNQIADSSFFRQRIEIAGPHKFKPNYKHFRSDN